MQEERWIIQRAHMQSLIDALVSRGYDVIGPVERAHALVYRQIDSIDELPIGRTDEQAGGHYRLTQGEDARSLFGYAVGPDAWKQFLHRPAVKLFSAKRDEAQGFKVIQNDEEMPKMAFLGVRACELHAIAIQDRVFLEGNYVDPHYKGRRENIFSIAVNCGKAGGTCFCTSMGTGPKVNSPFDLSLTEVLEGDSHTFVVEVGSEQGAEVLHDVPHTSAEAQQAQTADQIVENTAKQMGRTMDTTNLKTLLYENLDHARWDDVASRCLACGNCTMVCPTCFCTTVEDVTDLTGDHVERWRKWDSCFTGDFSYIHGGSVRPSHKARYRQWMTHKLASWVDQFGTSGCVGCGRCITWCPVGIDITEEVTAIQNDQMTKQKGEENGQTNT